MLDYGVDPNLANDDGLTALHQVSLHVTHRFSLRLSDAFTVQPRLDRVPYFDNYFPNYSMFV